MAVGVKVIDSIKNIFPEKNLELLYWTLLF